MWFSGFYPTFSPTFYWWELCFDTKVWQFFNFFTKVLFFCGKSNETSQKYSSLRSFGYLCQLLTPISVRERSDERWDLDLEFRQGAMYSQIQRKYKGTLLTSLLGGNPNRGLIFHRTVLEGYWELGAGIGTKMTATNCTFCSFRYV